MDLGLERAGMTCRWQVENNGYCQRILELRFPDVERRWGDVRTFNPGCPWRVDLVCGGDPCQENSNARPSHHQSLQPSLGHEFIRVLEMLRPRYVLRENPSVVRADAPWPWHRFRSELERLGYAVLPFRLRACCFGAPHRRDRLFLLAELADANSLRWTEGKRTESRKTTIIHKASSEPERCTWWEAEPAVQRVASRVPDRMERLRGIGNSVPPPMAEWIGRLIVSAEERQ